jgi:hypothetical protein
VSNRKFNKYPVSKLNQKTPSTEREDSLPLESSLWEQEMEHPSGNSAKLSFPGTTVLKLEVIIVLSSLKLYFTKHMKKYDINDQNTILSS